MRKSKYTPVTVPIKDDVFLYVIHIWYYDEKRKPLDNGVGKDRWFPAGGFPTVKLCTESDIESILADIQKDERDMGGVWRELTGNVPGARKFRVRKTKIVTEQWFDF